LPRGGQHTSKLNVPEALSKFQRPILAARDQRNVRATGVPAGERPLGFAVSNEVKAREHVLPVDYLFAPDFQFQSPDAIFSTQRRRERKAQRGRKKDIQVARPCRTETK
jgi:hypothetical protein